MWFPRFAKGENCHLCEVVLTSQGQPRDFIQRGMQCGRKISSSYRKLHMERLPLSSHPIKPFGLSFLFFLTLISHDFPFFLLSSPSIKHPPNKLRIWQEDQHTFVNSLKAFTKSSPIRRVGSLFIFLSTQKWILLRICSVIYFHT